MIRRMIGGASKKFLAAAEPVDAEAGQRDADRQHALERKAWQQRRWIVVRLGRR